MTSSVRPVKRIAIVGGGPSALFVYKHLVEQGHSQISVDIFERKSELGSGMPYSHDGANVEHITNVSCDEIPPLVAPIKEWLTTLPADDLERFHIDPENFSEHRVLPRLIFGRYLSNQFGALRQLGVLNGIVTTLQCNTTVTDVIDQPQTGTVLVEIAGARLVPFDHVIICTGHNWPRKHEGTIPAFFDSPYPPAKLATRINSAIALRGSALTAVDAIRTLARHNGSFEADKNGVLTFRVDEQSPDFRLVMHSRNGLLPCVRFHTDTPQIGSGSLLTDEVVRANMQQNDGFLSLDYVFDMNFKQPLREKDPDFYERIKDMRLEEFVDAMLALRDGVDPFAFFKGEYEEARKSIRRKESIHWKEMLSNLSFAMNYPAKHMSAEDMLRHQRVLMPLISIVIAFVPQTSCEELIALHDAGRLELLSVGADSHVDARDEGGATYTYQDENGDMVSTPYNMFVDCIGQPHLSLKDFPFQALVRSQSVAQARLQFRSDEEGERVLTSGDGNVDRDADGHYFLRVSGMEINDDFQIVGVDGVANPRIFMMAVPYIGGYNPDYSGLDFCEKAGSLVTTNIMAQLANN